MDMGNKDNQLSRKREISHSLDIWLLMKHLQMQRIFLIIWFMFGFLIPVVILVSSSIRLVKALNNSRRFHNVNSDQCMGERRRMSNLYAASLIQEN